jgi:dipeptidyl aminopeptidase/acylaminoacyl peptidase/murein tripeptide amidase MpaA
VKNYVAIIISFWVFHSNVPVTLGQTTSPVTVAEKSNYQATSRYADVMEFCEKLVKQSPLVRLHDMGKSSEGRRLPLLVIADPPVERPEDAAKTGKLVVLAIGNIHAGEVDGKEALLMLARDLVLAPSGPAPSPRPLPQGERGSAEGVRPLLKDLILLIAPIFNPDGNEKIDKGHRTTQVGPAEGVGIRFNAQGLDLNRDFVKLESPEVRALVQCFNQWDPAVFIDCHTTNGSYHRYTLTYEGGRCPIGDPKVVSYVRDVMMPDVTKRLESKTGYKSYFYGTISADRHKWETVPATPRYSTHYFGLRNRIGILSESYSYAPFKDRVLASKGFVRSIMHFTAEHKDAVARLLAEAREATVRAGREPQETDRLVLRQKSVPLGPPHQLLGYVEEVKNGRHIPTDQPKEYEVQYMGGVEPTLLVRRPYAYLFPATLKNVEENLKRHGIQIEELREDIELPVEAYRIDRIDRNQRVSSWEKLTVTKLEATARKETRKIPAGTVLVKTGQPLGSLAACLLEPQSEDGLATWKFFDSALEEGKDFPVLRLPAPVALTTGSASPLPDDPSDDGPIAIATSQGPQPPGFSGSGIGGMTWLEDGQHFLQVKEGRLSRVEAVTGKAEPLFDPEKLGKALAALPTIGAEAGRSLARSTSPRLNPQHTAALFEHQGDLYYGTLDGSKAVRLTKTPGAKELATFSPDGKFVAFVRENNLYVVDVATQTERALTTDGSALIFNGKADWVYYEEIFNRHYQAYWWSPDSSRVAFIRYDDTPIHVFTVLDEIPPLQKVESTRFPRAGDPNPLVRLGIASVGGDPIHWVDLREYSENSMLLDRAGWMPDGKNAYFYVQDRAQTWLDVCQVSRDGGAPTRLLRDTTKAWVDDPGPLTFLKDGSFLIFSERTGYKHLYHYASDGKLLGAVTSGEWENRGLQRVDEEKGWIYFTGTRDGWLGANLYRVKLDGKDIARLTKSGGDHHVSVSPKDDLFIDSFGDHKTPTRVQLVRMDGTVARTLDSNSPRSPGDKGGRFELVQIPTPDGFMLEGTVLKPPNFDPKKRYPVWFMTYGGPHAPSISDSWNPGRSREEALAQMGFIVFHADPRSASGKGAISTWTAYKKLGVPELADIETAIRWMNSHSYVDATRVGMSGHSYGGFMTSFALTHSKLFAAGIAGAPVTDWRNYDSIYTERYMNTPQENPEGYNATSVVKAAGNVSGKLLVLHGMMDDNVHLQNTAQLIDALQRANKDFEVMFYPRARHGIFGAHYQRLTVEFMKRMLRPELTVEVTERK